MSSRSRGLANRASATVVDRPRACSSSAAFSASARRVPSDRIAIREPSRRIAALADRQRLPALRQLDADAVAARIAQRDRAAVVRGGGRDHVHEFGLVGGRHHRHVRQAGEVGDVEGAGMRRAVGADQPGAVDREADRQVLDRDVVHDLVVGALQEGRVDGAERLACLRSRGRPRRSPRAARRCRRRTCARERPCRIRSTPVPCGMAAVIADDLLVAPRRLRAARRRRPWYRPARCSWAWPARR